MRELTSCLTIARCQMYLDLYLLTCKMGSFLLMAAV